MSNGLSPLIVHARQFGLSYGSRRTKVALTRLFAAAHASRRTRWPTRATPARANRRRQTGFTIIELLVALTVIALLLALIIPAIQASRESSRRLQCANHLRQIGTAIGSYESQYRMFPPGGAYVASMHVVILPFIDQAPLYAKYDFVRRDDSAVKRTVIPLYVCPSDPAAPRLSSGVAMTNYAGNSGTGVQANGYDGAFSHLATTFPPFPEGPIRAADFRDGLSNTAAVCEMLHADGSVARLRVNWNTPKSFPAAAQLGEFAKYCRGIPPEPSAYGWIGDVAARGVSWTVGEIGNTMYNHVLGPNEPSCYNGGAVQTALISAGSTHAGGVNLLLADGHVTFVGSMVDEVVWRDYGSRGPAAVVQLP